MLGALPAVLPCPASTEVELVTEQRTIDERCKGYRVDGKRCRGKRAHKIVSDLCWYHARQYWRKYGWC